MSKPTNKDLQAELMSLRVKHRAIEQENNAVKSDCKLLQEQLNMANGTVAELMKEVETLKELADTRLNELRDKAESLKTLHADYALLEEKYYTQSDNYTELNKMHDDLLSKFNKNLDQHRAIEAENYALKAEIERTNRHINLAENQLHREQQPTVVNHYHNCTINK